MVFCCSNKGTTIKSRNAFPDYAPRSISVRLNTACADSAQASLRSGVSTSAKRRRDLAFTRLYKDNTTYS